jgi:hypothetical protein
VQSGVGDLVTAEVPAFRDQVLPVGLPRRILDGLLGQGGAAVACEPVLRVQGVRKVDTHLGYVPRVPRPTTLSPYAHLWLGADNRGAYGVVGKSSAGCRSRGEGAKCQPLITRESWH